MTLGLLHIYLETHLENDYQAFCQHFKDVLNHGVKEYSISPVNEYGQYGEIYITLQIEPENIENMLQFMSDGWDGEPDDCFCTAFTSHVFDQHINSIYFQIPD